MTVQATLSMSTSVFPHRCTPTATSHCQYSRPLTGIPPQEGGLNDALHRGRPTQLLGHGQDGDAHADAVHVTEHLGARRRVMGQLSESDWLRDWASYIACQRRGVLPGPRPSAARRVTKPSSCHSRLATRPHSAHRLRPKLSACASHGWRCEQRRSRCRRGCPHVVAYMRVETRTHSAGGIGCHRAARTFPIEADLSATASAARMPR